jgi:hypothetical protein
MSENIKVIYIAKQGASRVESLAYDSNMLFKNKLHIPMKAFTPDDIKKIEGLMVKNKKDCEFCASFDGDTVKYFARIGSDKIYKECDPKSAAKLSDPGISGVDKRNDLLDELVSYGIATKAQADALKKKPIRI